MSRKPRPYSEYSVVRTLVDKNDEKGRPVPTGSRGTIVHVYPAEENLPTTYIIEVPLIDERGTPSDSYIFDARHEELRPES